jgi:hypothetical protein
MEKTKQIMADKFTEITKEVQMKDSQNLTTSWNKRDANNIQNSRRVQ